MGWGFDGMWQLGASAPTATQPRPWPGVRWPPPAIEPVGAGAPKAIEGVAMDPPTH